VAELKKLAFLRGLEAAGWGPLGNDPQPAQVSGTDYGKSIENKDRF